MINTEKGKAEVARFAIDVAIRVALIAAVVYASMLLLQPVAPLMLWAIILSVAVYPLFLLMRRRLGLRNGLAAALLSLVLLVLLVTPVVILAGSAIESLDTYARMLAKGGHVVPPPPESVREWPMIGQRVYDFWLTASNDIKALLAAHVGQIASLGRFFGRLAPGVFPWALQCARPPPRAGA
ncbi:MAG: AI-2E family transporter, partial [Reyranella sp.]|nr:AI-2E family transporter [Reyranella sp.]